MEVFFGWQIFMVLGQNGSGQNGTDKMVWTKWYRDKMVLDKMAWTKWHGQNGTDQILRIWSSINPALIYNMIVSSTLRCSDFHFNRFFFQIIIPLHVMGLSCGCVSWGLPNLSNLPCNKRYLT